MDFLPTKWELNDAMPTDSAMMLRFHIEVTGAEPVMARS